MNVSLRHDGFTKSDRDTVIATLVAAFKGDAAVPSFYPDVANYRRHFPGFLVAFGGRAFDAAAVGRNPHERGAALWFPARGGRS